MEEYIQDFDTRIMKQKAMNILKQDYIISSLHKISGELILKFHIEKYKARVDIEEKFVYHKDLERELEYKFNLINQSESELETITSKTHTNFISYINGLNLPTHVCDKQFKFLKPQDKPDLLYVYYPAFKGSKIIKKSDFIDDEDMSSQEYKSR